ncbi:MAG: hypothetical protein MK110_08365 [Fuerstiella sp.]|nr:hypothetical protein [Fuerstiella sp.]
MKTCVFGIVPKAAQTAIFCLLLIVVPDIPAQTSTNTAAPAIPPTWDFDFDLFQTLLEIEGLESQPNEPGQNLGLDRDRMMVAPSRSVMILTGKLEGVSSWNLFHNFLKKGGVILVASNEPTDMYGFFRIDFGPVTAGDPNLRWQGHQDCIQLTDINHSNALMNGVSTIVINRSGWIDRLNDSMEYQWSPLVVLPDRVHPPESVHQPVIAVAQSRRNGTGRLVVLADGSLLSNGMLWHGNNLTLLVNLVQELTRDNRNAYIFLNDGQPVENRVTGLIRQLAPDVLTNLRSASDQIPAEQSSDLPLEALANLPGETLLDIGNTLAARIDDSEILNQLLADRPRYQASRFYRRSILFAIFAAGVTIFLIRSYLADQSPSPWLKQPRRPRGPASPATVPVTDYDQATRALARDTCRYFTGSGDPKDWRSRLQPDGDLWRTLSSRSPVPSATIDTMDQVLSFSTETENTQLSHQQFERFGESVYQLRQLHQPVKCARSNPV